MSSNTKITLAGSWLAFCVLTGVLLAEDAKQPAVPFNDNVKVTTTDKHWIVASDGIPTHKTGTFPNAKNPNTIQKQNYRFVIPREPHKAAKITPLPMGPIGVAVNGIPFYNPYNAEGRNAVEGMFAETFDSCCGHPDPQGRYHYHKYPVCVKSPFKDAPGEHSPLIGYAFDGYAIYGPNDDGGAPPKNLDECNGHTDDVRGYHYHVTTKFPYILGGYRGEVEQQNFDRPGGGRPPHPLLQTLDLDSDGELSAAEIEQAPKLLPKLDTNRDGKLSPPEYRPARPGPPARPRPLAP